jgi:hypothetical protein
MASSNEKIEEFLSYEDYLYQAARKQVRNKIYKRTPGGGIWLFTDYGSINSNEDFEDSKYFIYDDFKKN